MKKQLLFLVTLLLILESCKTNPPVREINDITIKEFKIDSTSIRAIQVIGSDKMYFAGSNGTIGYTTDGGKNWSTQKIKYKDSITPNFRSIAKTDSAIFALSIENPALLYKIANNNPVLVYEENHPKAFYDSMCFLDDKNGIAMGDPTDDCLSVIITKDGGDSCEFEC